MTQQLNELIQRLCDADIDFVIVGGFAGILHGSTLVTRDLDICAIAFAGATLPGCERHFVI